MRHLAALGGREALAGLTSRVSRGSITLTTPAGPIEGTVTVYAKAPRKTRTVIELDLSAFGAPNATIDERFDGTSGYVLDTMNGDREVTGSQLDVMRFGGFHSPLLDHEARGMRVALVGEEPLGDGTATLTAITHNVEIDDADFVRPAE